MDANEDEIRFKPAFLKDLIAKLEGDPNLRAEDVPLDDLSQLESASEVRIADLAETICGILARAFSTRMFVNLRTLTLNGRCDHEEETWEWCHGVCWSIALGHLPNLESLTLRRLGVGAEAMMFILKAAEAGYLSKLRCLDLHMQFGSRGAGRIPALAKGMKANQFSSLEILRLDSGAEFFHIQRADARILGLAIEAGCLSNLRCLDLRGIDIDGGVTIAAGLRSGNVNFLQDLILHGCQISAEGLIAIAGALDTPSTPELKTLSLECKSVNLNHDLDTNTHQQATETMAKALASRHVRHLERLILDGFTGGEMIMGALSSGRFTVLRELQLMHGEMRGTAAIGIAVSSLPSLRVLALQFGKDEGALQSLASAFGNVADLARLCLAWDYRDDGGLGAVAQVLEKQVLELELLQLETTSLQRIRLKEKDADAMVGAFQRNPFLTVKLEVEWPEGQPWLQEIYKEFRGRNQRFVVAMRRPLKEDGESEVFQGCRLKKSIKANTDKALKKLGFSLAPVASPHLDLNHPPRRTTRRNGDHATDLTCS